MNKLKKLAFIFVLILVLFNTDVNAASFKYTPGGSIYDSPGGCPNCSWVYTDEGLGVRLSLYKYDGKTLTFQKSVDLVNSPSSYPDKIYATASSNRKGRYNYSKLGETVSFSEYTKNLKSFSEYGFSKIVPDTNWAVKLSGEIADYFGDDEKETRKQIKAMFGVNVSTSAAELSKYYLVVEPSIIFYSRVGSFYSYGTGYEYMSVKDILNDNYKGNYEWSFFGSQGKTIRDYLYNGMYNKRNSSLLYEINGKTDGRYDYYNFISQTPNNGALVLTASSLISDKNAIGANNKYAEVDYPYGIMVFWLGKDDPSIGKCTGACNGLTGDALLKCAENYCSAQAEVTNKNEKGQCIINECKYSYTRLNCGTSPKNNGNDTECAASTSSNKGSCEIVNKSNYSYKVECNTSSTVTYPDTLPNTLVAGQGFEYRVRLYGNKTCTVTFDEALWKFNYASSYNDDERQSYLDAITDYNKLSLSNYYFDSSTANISIDINEREDGKNKKTSKNLVAEEKYAQGDQIVTTTSTSKTIKSYHHNNTISKDIKIYETDSSNSTYYELPGVCISAKDNVTVTEKNRCDNGLGPYNKYYTGIYADETTNKVTATVTYNPSGLEKVKNYCDYTITDKTIDCYIEIQTESGQSGTALKNYEDIRFMLYATTPERDRTIRYNIDTNGFKEIDNKFNNKAIYTITKNSIKDSQEITVYGTVTDGETRALCSKTVTINPQTCEWVKTTNEASNETTVKIKNVSDKNAKYYIRTSTSNKWMNIQQRTISNDTTIKLDGKVVTDTGTYYCYYENTYEEDNKKNRCTELYKPAEYKKIKDYCSLHWQEDRNNYSSYDDCYASCTGGNTCKQKYRCSDVSNIRQYCKVNYQIDGYNTIGDCINDCTCDTTGVDYYYRTITLNNPFPQREAHYNWLGYEEYITNDNEDITSSTSGSPEYEIVLDSKRISKIQTDTARYNATSGNDAYGDYVRENENVTGTYKSKFIHYDDTSDGGFRSYFTYIEGAKTS